MIAFILKIETRFAFEPQMGQFFVEASKNQAFNQDGDKPGILKNILQSN